MEPGNQLLIQSFFKISTSRKKYQKLLESPGIESSMSLLSALRYINSPGLCHNSVFKDLDFFPLCNISLVYHIDNNSNTT